VNKKAAKILQKYQGKRAGIFIDDANMFHAQKRVRWQIDWKKFKEFLEENFKVKFIKYYRGVYSKKEKVDKRIREKHNQYSRIIKRIGFELIKRPLKKIYTNKKQNKFKYKCDFDAEIGFDIAANLNKVDLIIVVSGDSDFASLSQKIVNSKKHYLMICFRKRAPWEIYRISHIFFEEIREEVEKLNKKTPPKG